MDSALRETLNRARLGRTCGWFVEFPGWLRRQVMARISCLALLCCLIGCGGPVEQLANAVRGSYDPKAMGDAISAVHQSGRDEEAFTIVSPYLRHPNAGVRAQATWAIASLNVKSSRKVAVLIECLSDADSSVRYEAAEGLGEVGGSDPRVVPALRKALRDTEPMIRRNALEAIAKIGPEANAAIPDLIAQLATSEDWVAAAALGSVGIEARAALPALTDLLQRSEGYARLHAAEAIWRIDRNAVLTVPALIDLLRDDYGPIRVAAAETLGEIGPSAADALPALREMLRHKPQRDRPPPTPGGNCQPSLVEMTEAEFYPQIEHAASAAIEQIAGAKEIR